MAEGTEPIRQDIDDIRGSMTETLEQIEARVRGTVDNTVGNVRQAFDLRHQVNERPWLSLGLAVAAGYLIGSMGGDDRPQPQYGRPGQAMRYYPEHGYRPDTGGPSYSASQGISASQGYTPSQSYSSPQSYGQGYSQGQQFNHEPAHQPNRMAGQMGGMLSRMAQPMGDELSTIAMAAVRSAMRMLRESLQSNIPQFDAEYQRVQGERSGMDDMGDLASRYGTGSASDVSSGGSYSTSGPLSGSYGTSGTSATSGTSGTLGGGGSSYGTTSGMTGGDRSGTGRSEL